jgi:hypothetical protein
MTGRTLTNEAGEGPLRRHFIAVATSRYTDPSLSQLPGVVDEVRTLRRWWCATDLGERRFTPLHPHLATSPTDKDITAALRNPKPLWNDGDAAVVFVTGHGLIDNGMHWLALKQTSVGYVAGHSVRAADVVLWLGQHRQTPMLVIFDLCYAGAITEDVVKFDFDFPPHWLVLASVTRRQQAHIGALTEVIDQILTEISTATRSPFGNGRYLSPAQFFAEVQDRLLPRQTLVQLDGRVLPSTPHPCLPNPRHRPEAVPAVQTRRRDLALRPEDLASHWGPRSRGVMRQNEPGWLFTGRAELMRRLVAAATGEAGSVVVTGAAGCGKSAVLARLVTLSDPTFRETYKAEIAGVPADLYPPEGAVDVAVLATGRVPHELLARICYALEVPVNVDPGSVPDLADLRTSWWTWLSDQDQPVTIVVDALDEASQPRAVLDEVLTQLEPPKATPARVRLIVGVRSAGRPESATWDAQTAALADRVEAALAARRMRVDQPPLWNTPDLIDYVKLTLRADEESPYGAADSAAVTTVAEALAAKAGTSYLIARLEAARLATLDRTIDPTDPNWLADLDNGIVGVFRQDLRTTFPDPIDQERAVHLLRAVAFAYGRGLPWYQIWPRVANAVANHPDRTYGDRDIEWLLESRLGGYLVTDVEDEVTVYRLFHDALRQTLRVRWRDLL